MKRKFLNFSGVVFVFALLQFLLGCQTQDQVSENEPGFSPIQKQPAQKENIVKQKQNIQRKIVSKINTVSEDPLDDADAVYEGNENISEGVYIYQNLVFVVVAVDLEKKYQIEPEGVAMLRENQLLRKKFNLPNGISLSRIQIQNGTDDDDKFYRYVTAYRLKDIMALKHKR